MITYNKNSTNSEIEGLRQQDAQRPAGGEPSRLVTRGESTPTHIATNSHIALIDWLAFTVPPDNGRDWRWMRECLKNIFDISPESWKGTDRKWSGYQHRVDLIYPGERGESVHLGLVAYGGESQRGTIHVSLNATACARIKDWELVQAWGESVVAVITRADCAHDDFEGQILTIEKVLQWNKEGLFSTNGRPPSAELIDDLGSGKGKTFYVGNRAHGKLVRIYEKGKKEGDPNSPWVRAEVEWRNKSRVIPWDIITTPGQYLAGAYPCLSYLSIEQSRIKTIKKTASINYAGMVHWLKNSAGKSLNVMLQVEGDANSVLEQLRRNGAPKRLEPYVGLKGAMPVKKRGTTDITQGTKSADNESETVGFNERMLKRQKSHENAES